MNAFLAKIERRMGDLARRTSRAAEGGADSAIAMHGRALVLVSVVGALGALGCAKAPSQSDSVSVAPAPERAGAQRANTTPLKPLDRKKFGAEITEKTSTALDALIKEPAKFTAKTVRTEGVVSAVCKSMGCWMEIADPAGQAHIKMAGHGFFVPKDASGHRAVVQGTVLRPSSDECSEEAKAQTGAVAKIEIEATGVEFVD
jgi:hypothetical protein